MRTVVLAAAQCAHAAVGVVEDMRQHNKLLLRQWEEYGSAKIALKCPNQAELVSLWQCRAVSNVMSSIPHSGKAWFSDILTENVLHW